MYFFKTTLRKSSFNALKGKNSNSSSRQTKPNEIMWTEANFHLVFPKNIPCIFQKNPTNLVTLGIGCQLSVDGNGKLVNSQQLIGQSQQSTVICLASCCTHRIQLACLASLPHVDQGRSHVECLVSTPNWVSNLYMCRSKNYPCH